MILGHQADKMGEITSILEAEEAYQTFEYLKENASQYIIARVPKIKYLNDKEALMKEIVINGAPDDQELFNIYKKTA